MIARRALVAGALLVDLSSAFLPSPGSRAAGRSVSQARSLHPHAASVARKSADDAVPDGYADIPKDDAPPFLGSLWPGNWSTETMDIPDLSEKVIVLTGGYAGLGGAAADALLRGNPRRLIVVGDNQQKGQDFLQELKQSHDNPNVDFMFCNLSDFKSVREFADEFEKLDLPLHTLINNAGIWFPPHMKNAEGLEITVATNFFGPFLLTQLLLPKLLKSAPSRIVWLSSWGEAIGQLDWDDLGFTKAKSSTVFHYASSKLYDHLASMEMADRLQDKGVLVVTAHPGIAYSQFVHKVSSQNPLRYLFPILGKIFPTHPVQRGAVSQVVAATKEDVVPGGFYGPNLFLFGFDQTGPTYNFHTWSKEDRKRFYEEALKIVGVEDRTAVTE